MTVSVPFLPGFLLVSILRMLLEARRCKRPGKGAKKKGREKQRRPALSWKKNLYTRGKKISLERRKGNFWRCLPAEQFCFKKDIKKKFFFWTHSDLLYPPPCPPFLFGTFKMVLLLFHNSDLLGVIAETFPLLWSSCLFNNDPPLTPYPSAAFHKHVPRGLGGKASGVCLCAPKASCVWGLISPHFWGCSSLNPPLCKVNCSLKFGWYRLGGLAFTFEGNSNCVSSFPGMFL